VRDGSSGQSPCDRGGKGVKAFEAGFQSAKDSSEGTPGILGRHDIFSRRVLLSIGPTIGGIEVVCRPFAFNGQWLFTETSQYNEIQPIIPLNHVQQ
jgi:hypothetical protein